MDIKYEINKVYEKVIAINTGDSIFYVLDAFNGNLDLHIAIINSDPDNMSFFINGDEPEFELFKNLLAKIREVTGDDHIEDDCSPSDRLDFVLLTDGIELRLYLEDEKKEIPSIRLCRDGSKNYDVVSAVFQFKEELKRYSPELMS